MSSGVDFVSEYKNYLERFDTEVGDADFGAFVKHGGHLVRKLLFDDFEPLYREYLDIARTYFDSMDRGDTINDVVVKMLRERAADLVLPSPVL